MSTRVLRGVDQLVDHRLLDRLIRGRAWIGLVTFALLSIVTMQVALLKLNTGIGRSIERAAALQQQNTALEAQISSLASGDRITTAASGAGMVYPPAGDVSYLRAGSADPERALHALDAGLAQPLVALSAQGTLPASSTTAATGTGQTSASAAATTAAVAATTSGTNATTSGAGVAGVNPSGASATPAAAATSPTGTAGGASATPTGTGAIAAGPPATGR